jgi:hypothetical protein
MLTNAKIDLKKYSIYTTILILISYFVIRSISEYLVIVSVCIAVCINHWMSLFVVRKMSENVVMGNSKNSHLIPLFNIGKIILVIGALSFGVQIMGKRIIIPVLIYVLQIVVLYLSFEKKISAEQGS